MTPDEVQPGTENGGRGEASEAAAGPPSDWKPRQKPGLRLPLRHRPGALKLL